MLYAFWGTLSEKSNVTFNGLISLTMAKKQATATLIQYFQS